MTVLAVALAGALGAPSRYLVERAISARRGRYFPWGTLVVNVTGSLTLGFLTGLALYHGLATTPKAVVGTGFIGAYTTFSTYTYETVDVAERTSARVAGTYAVVSIVAGVAGATLGLMLAAL
ncbi:MAG TPA: fluoride efflux transporter CrcB [Acidimicrobiia bacterium]